MMLGNNNSSSSLVAANSTAGNNTHDGGGSGSGSGSIPGGGGGGFSDEDKARMEVGDSGGGGGGGNRWPRQETLELLRIRSEMEIAFRDSNLKSPLWEEVSRKMAELGYRRSAKKCKEKFENVYKYHKRTKDGRASKSDGKTYRFFEQLEALEKNTTISSLPSPQPHPQPRLLQIQAPMPLSATAIGTGPVPIAVVAAAPLASNTNVNVTVSSAPAAIPVSFSPNLNNNPLFNTLPFSTQHMSVPAAAVAAVAENSANMNNPPPPPPQGNTTAFQSSHHANVFSSLPSDEFTSSSTSSDEDIRRRHKRKRKLKDFFEGMLQNMMEKQEQLHKNFLEALERRERDRMIREEAWRVQEMARMNRELDLLNQERSMAAAKDAVVTAFLQKFAPQENHLKHPTGGTNNAPQIQLSLPKQNSQPQPQPSQPQPMEITTPKTAPPPQAVPPPQPQPPAPAATAEAYGLALAIRHEANNNGGENFMTPSPSRWPKTEVEALIKLRSNMDMKYQDNLPKGPLWEEISAQMSKLGYNRSSKRCKEKWENINKYFKKVKESSKIRPEDSKTCPYFHLLDALYKEKEAKADANANSYHISYANPIKHDQAPLAIMARPEQQWPVPIQESGNAMDEDDELDSENYDDENDDDEEEDEEGSHEMVTNKQQAATTATVSVTTTTATVV